MDFITTVLSENPVLSASVSLLSLGVIAIILEKRRHSQFVSQRIRPALPAGDLNHVSPRVIHVTGTAYMMPFVKFNRAMTVIITPTESGDRNELTILNAVRLPDAQEQELLKFGDIKHVVTINTVHGIDLPYYVDKFKPTLWAPPRKAEQLAKLGLKNDRALEAGTELPFPDAHVFEFASEALEPSKGAECCIVLEKEKALICCDCFQNMTDVTGCTPLGALICKGMGFVHPHNIGPGWLMMLNATAKECGDTPPKIHSEFHRLLEEESGWCNLLPGHGYASMDGTAREGLRQSMKRAWPKFD